MAFSLSLSSHSFIMINITCSTIFIWIYSDIYIYIHSSCYTHRSDQRIYMNFWSKHMGESGLNIIDPLYVLEESEDKEAASLLCAFCILYNQKQDPPTSTPPSIIIFMSCVSLSAFYWEQTAVFTTSLAGWTFHK